MGNSRTGKKLPQGIDRLPSGTYRARLAVDGYQHTIGTFHTIGDARAALDIARAEKARGTFEPPMEKRRRLKAEREQRRAETAGDGRTVRELAEAWLSWLEASGLKAGTVYTYRRHLEAHFLPTFGERPVGEVTAIEVNDWLDGMEAGALGIDGTARIHRDVAALFRFATGDAAELPRTFEPWLLTSPVPPLAARKFRRKNRPAERARDVIAPDDLARLADLMPEPDRLAVLLAGWAGLRLGQQGATLAELKAYAGHSDVKSVEVYQHAERSRLSALTARMGGEV